MLLFIESLSADINTVTLVSIHLMLLFIPPESAQRSLSDYVSIHLMLLFIYLLVTINKIKVSFNTSHVTLYLMSAFPSQEVQFRFNTSHVTLYLLRIKFQHGCANSFQYISCYSLSDREAESHKVHTLFQYISCYSLSLVFPIFSLLTFFIISQNTRVCNIFPKQHRLFESFHRSTPKPYIFTTFHIFL